MNKNSSPTSDYIIPMSLISRLKNPVNLPTLPKINSSQILTSASQPVSSTFQSIPSNTVQSSSSNTTQSISNIRPRFSPRQSPSTNQINNIRLQSPSTTQINTTRPQSPPRQSSSTTQINTTRPQSSPRQSSSTTQINNIRLQSPPTQSPSTTQINNIRLQSPPRQSPSTTQINNIRLQSPPRQSSSTTQINTTRPQSPPRQSSSTTQINTTRLQSPPRQSPSTTQINNIRPQSPPRQSSSTTQINTTRLQSPPKQSLSTSQINNIDTGSQQTSGEQFKDKVRVRKSIRTQVQLPKLRGTDMGLPKIQMPKVNLQKPTNISERPTKVQPIRIPMLQPLPTVSPVPNNYRVSEQTPVVTINAEDMIDLTEEQRIINQQLEELYFGPISPRNVITDTTTPRDQITTSLRSEQPFTDIMNGVPQIQDINSNPKVNRSLSPVNTVTPTKVEENTGKGKRILETHVTSEDQTSEGISECCICLDEKVNENDKLTCKHTVCPSCIALLNKPECPMCRTYLEGSLVTSELLANIMNRQEDYNQRSQTANYLASLYIQEHPEADPEDVYKRFNDTI